MDTDEPQPSAPDVSPEMRGADAVTTSDCEGALGGITWVEGECAEAVAELFTFLDGALTEERRGLITAHLDECAPCFDAFEFHIELRAVIRQRCRSQLPEGLKERIFRQLREQRSDPEGTLGV